MQALVALCLRYEAKLGYKETKTQISRARAYTYNQASAIFLSAPLYAGGFLGSGCERSEKLRKMLARTASLFLKRLKTPLAANLPCR
ncbi:hypothetical protein CRECT_1933 [Campylobacter rectus]|uniref:Uncharacterized protein n=1 Tax=Campylobacter rectus TaxID=203 RepID=A0A6G5QQ12_CAMRE|nr:hypothetical protein CRECT_1933 [Campylobacter rectus]